MEPVINRWNHWYQGLKLLRLQFFFCLQHPEVLYSSKWNRHPTQGSLMYLSIWCEVLCEERNQIRHFHQSRWRSIPPIVPSSWIMVWMSLPWAVSTHKNKLKILCWPHLFIFRFYLKYIQALNHRLCT